MQERCRTAHRATLARGDTSKPALESRYRAAASSGPTTDSRIRTWRSRGSGSLAWPSSAVRKPQMTSCLRVPAPCAFAGLYASTAHGEMTTGSTFASNHGGERPIPEQKEWLGGLHPECHARLLTTCREICPTLGRSSRDGRTSEPMIVSSRAGRLGVSFPWHPG